MAFVVTAITAEVVSVLAVATAVAELGMVMSVAGAVTGNKTLAKYGGYLSLAGGVVALGASAFSAISGAAAAGESVASAAAGEAAVGAVGEEVAKSYAVDLGINGADDIVTSAFKSAGESAATAGELSMLDPSGLGAQSAASGVNSASNLATSSNINSASNIAAAPSVASPINEAASKAATTASTAGESYSASYSGKPLYGANGTTNLASGLGSGSGASGNWLKSWWNGLDSSTKNAALSMTGKVAEGIFAGWSQEQRNEFEKEKWNLMQSNANAQPVMTFKRPGLINSRG